MSQFWVVTLHWLLKYLLQTRIRQAFSVKTSIGNILGIVIYEVTVASVPLCRWMAKASLGDKQLDVAGLSLHIIYRNWIGFTSGLSWLPPALSHWCDTQPILFYWKYITAIFCVDLLGERQCILLRIYNRTWALGYTSSWLISISCFWSECSFIFCSMYLHPHPTKADFLILLFR